MATLATQDKAEVVGEAALQQAVVVVAAAGAVVQAVLQAKAAERASPWRATRVPLPFSSACSQAAKPVTAVTVARAKMVQGEEKQEKPQVPAPAAPEATARAVVAAQVVQAVSRQASCVWAAR